MRQPRRMLSVPMTATGTTARRSPAPGDRRRAWGCQRAGAGAGALGEDDDDVAALEDLSRQAHGVLVTGPAVDREGAEAVQEPRLPAVAEELLLGHEVDRPAYQRADDEGVEERPMV